MFLEEEEEQGRAGAAAEAVKYIFKVSDNIIIMIMILLAKTNIFKKIINSQP